jgi:hypothetical protein
MTVSVNIEISNIAETVPTLGGDLTLSVIETTITASTLGLIVISDEGDTPISSFEINGTDNNKFAIANDGTITLVSAVDYETKSFYEFNVTAMNSLGRSNTIKLDINITDYEELVISLAVYDDNNNTMTATDDILRVYFSKDIDELNRADESVDNYEINGTGDLDDEIGVYYIVLKEDRMTGIVTVLSLYDTNISVLADTITDLTGISAETNPVKIISNRAIKSTEHNSSYNADGSVHIAGTQRDDGYYKTGFKAEYSRDDTNEIVLDHITGLMWADNIDAESVTKSWVTSTVYFANNDNMDTSGNTASTYCENLTLGGYSDWRLPLVAELENIVSYSDINTSIEGEYFQNVSDDYYWSSSSDIGENHNAWRVSFFDGQVNTNKKLEDTMHVRCVRGRK